jgi:E3 ubiquitin-protein ligase HERC2
MHSAAVTEDGKLYTWGSSSYGRLGHGDREDLNVPKQVSSISSKIIVEVSCGHGDAHTLLRTSDGAVYSFGDTDHGKLGRS